MSIPRRDVLKGLGAGAAVACGPRIEAEAGSIDHIVLVMMENRSFDHYLGSLSLEEGRTDVDGLVDGLSNPDPHGGDDLTPFHTDAHCVPDLPHSWDSSHRQVADGAMSGFATEYSRRGGTPREALGYFTRADLPITYALADAYTVCDRWFASILTSTWPNRMYAIAGQSLGERGNDLDSGLTGFDLPSIFESLDAAGISWGSYSTSLPTLWLVNQLRARDELTDLDHFFAHARDGRLPAVSWVDPAFGVADDHPPLHPMLGQLFLASIHEALAQSPAWERTLLVIYYDEHGGFYDHVAPPTAPDDLASDGFDQLGVRIPAIVCGPYVRRGVDSAVRDHTSVLAHIERSFELEPLTTRTASAEDLWSTIDAERLAAGTPRDPAVLPVLTMTEEEIEAECERARRSGPAQPLLERIVDRYPAPAHLDRRREHDAVLRGLFDHARRLGVLRS